MLAWVGTASGAAGGTFLGSGMSLLSCPPVHHVTLIFLTRVSIKVHSAVALAVTSRTMVKFGYISCNCAMLKCALLLVTLDVDVCAGKISVLARVPRVKSRKVWVLLGHQPPHPNAGTQNRAESHP